MAQTIQQQIDMYGMPVSTIREQYMESLTAKMSGQEMVVASILSDCQAMAEYQHAAPVNAKATQNRIRQHLNVAKFILFEMLDQKEMV